MRTACGLAALTRKPCRIFNIRLRRRRPGLQVQHLLGVRAVAELCAARLTGDQVSSEELEFCPGEILPHDLRIRIPTAGSITLILQSLIPAALGASKPVIVNFEGGATDTPMAPPLDYFRHVFLWFLSRIGINIEVKVFRRGHYPKGGAALEAQITPAHPKPITTTERGQFKRLTVVSYASEILKPRRVAERQIEGAMEALGKLPLAPERVINYGVSISPGSCVCIVAEFGNTLIAADALGERGKRAEQVGAEAARDYLKEADSAAALDRHMADQILPYMALAGEGSRVTVSEVTEHCRTNMWVIENFLDGKFAVETNLIRWIVSRKT